MGIIKDVIASKIHRVVKVKAQKTHLNKSITHNFIAAKNSWLKNTQRTSLSSSAFFNFHQYRSYITFPQQSPTSSNATDETPIPPLATTREKSSSNSKINYWN